MASLSVQAGAVSLIALCAIVVIVFLPQIVRGAIPLWCKLPRIVVKPIGNGPLSTPLSINVGVVALALVAGVAALIF